MPRKKENLRLTTFNKLVQIGKANEKDILNLRIEDLIEITNDIDVQNLILLRKYIKEHNTIEYFNEKQTKKEGSEQSG